MTPKSFLLTTELHDYLIGHSDPVDEVQADLIAETAALGEISSMQIAPEQGLLMTMLTRLIGARNAIEIGTFTGYSALAIARGLPEDGHLLCLDVSAQWTDVALRYWQRAGVADRIELILGPAADTLRSLPDEPMYDLAFLDADKAAYWVYLEELHPRMRPNSLIVVDNVLRGGRVLEDGGSRDDAAIRAFNDSMAGDDRFDTVLLPVADGLTFLRKR